MWLLLLGEVMRLGRMADRRHRLRSGGGIPAPSAVWKPPISENRKNDSVIPRIFRTFLCKLLKHIPLKTPDRSNEVENN